VRAFGQRRRRGRLWLAAAVTVLVLAYLAGPALLGVAGRFLVADDRVTVADAAVVLTTGIEYYPRLIEAAALYREGRVARVVVNGNRKSDVLRRLEARGFVHAAPWNEDFLRILELLGVPRAHVLSVSAEDAYDTVSESRLVAPALVAAGIGSVLVTTSKSHTRRAGYIWRHLHGDELRIATAAARDDPYQPDDWWRSGRQIRWVLAEYGAWLYLHWKLATGAR
jgi:uncharacterized SAM-binding protein YcdF (DUF218 family)